MASKRGPLIVISGASGCGKSTVIRALLQRGDLPLHLSVSATTRPQRPGEQNGRDYFFCSREEFEKELAAGGFLEHARVVDYYYGTLQREVEPYRQRGIGVLLDIDTQGQRNIHAACPDAVTIFLLASSPSAYEERLRRRGTESEEAIRRRLANGLKEITHANEYDYRVVNDDVDTAVAEIHRILTDAFARSEHAG